MVERTDSLTGQMAGGCLMAVGGLIVAFCGLCTAVVIAGGSSEYTPGAGGALLIGGVPIVVGALIIWGGHRLYSWATPKPLPPSPPAHFTGDDARRRTDDTDEQ